MRQAGTDADYVVKLIDVFPEYTEPNVEQKKNKVVMTATRCWSGRR